MSYQKVVHLIEGRKRKKEEKEIKQKNIEKKNKTQSNKDDADIHAQVRQSQSLFHC